MGVIYDTGEVVSQSREQAINWYRKAAEQGHPKAQASLGISYAKGEGVLPDYVQSYAWLAVAAENGHQTAAAYRDDLATELSTEQLEQAKALAKQYIGKYKPGT